MEESIIQTAAETGVAKPKKRVFSADANVENKTYYEAGGAKRRQFRPRAGHKSTNPKTAQSVQAPSAKVLQNGQSVQVANESKEGVKIATFNNFDQD